MGRVLRAMDAGLIVKVNFYFIFDKNLEVTEGDWYLRHQSDDKGYGGDGFWKLWLTRNGKRVDFETYGNSLESSIVKKTEQNLQPDGNGMVKMKSDNYSRVRWNVTLHKK